MGVLLFSNNGKESEKKLVRAINGIANQHSLEVFHTIETISQRLRQPQKNPALMVILAGSREDLNDLYFLKDLFWNIPLILILPDSDQETRNMGFKLFPRYVSFKDGSFKDVQSVM
ncbi:MAG: hypothetical protein L7F78_02955, partial [Syntrophales bacterium LBB04]|nr:hypothetical protein [Syntrophales bacterium LBB04]